MLDLFISTTLHHVLDAVIRLILLGDDDDLKIQLLLTTMNHGFVTSYDSVLVSQA
jgi:hypothetical protein